jgi:uncharacterized protein (TIGR04168 family)
MEFSMLEIDGKESGMTSQKTQSKTSLKIAVVGDVHDQWEQEDGVALKYLGVDLVLFVGDFGNESVEVVREVASLDMPKAVVLGNHDAWYTATEWGRKKCPYDRSQENRVQAQLDILDISHVGYSKLDFPAFNLTVVGGRPFTWGGPDLKFAEICQELYGVSTIEESVAKISAAVKSAGHETIIFLGHNGPSGLGNKPEDPCGKDWLPVGGDFGDPDLAEAITLSITMGKNVPLVAFGHMHHALRHTKTKRKAFFKSPDGRIYLNTASVPRIITQADGRKLRNFSLVSLEAGVVTQAALVWLDSDLQVDAAETQIFYEKPLSTLPFA